MIRFHNLKRILIFLCVLTNLFTPILLNHAKIAKASTFPPFVWGSTTSPTTPTNSNVTITIYAGDSGSGVKSITLPNNVVVNSNTATYTASQNGDYTFIITNNSGDTSQYVVTVSNIDKTLPTVSNLVLFQTAPSTYQVTANIDDDSGIATVKLNTGQSLTKIDTDTYQASNLNLSSPPVSLQITDVAGNYETVNFISMPSVTVSTTNPPGGEYNTDVTVSLNGANNLGYVDNGMTYNCQSNPCPYTFTKNGTINPFNQSGVVTSMNTYSINNIDKNIYKLNLTGSRSSSSLNTLNFNWDLAVSTPKLSCTSYSDNLNVSVTNYSYTYSTAKNETYQCSLQGYYQGYSVTSNSVLIYQSMQDNIQYDRSKYVSTTFTQNVLHEKGRSGEFYVFNVNRDNNSQASVLIPYSLTH